MVKSSSFSFAVVVLLFQSSAAFAFGKAPPPPVVSPNWDGNIVYYVTGGPIEVQPGNVNESATRLKTELTAVHGELYFGYKHNSRWNEICTEIKNMRLAANSPKGKLVILGHSYGASATTRISRCLQVEGIPVDLAIYVDMIRRPVDSKPDVIPGNIVTAQNYYQTKDFTFRGRKNVRREDESYVGITNTEINAPGASPHFGIITHLMLDTDTVEHLVLDLLQ